MPKPRERYRFGRILNEVLVEFENFNLRNYNNANLAIIYCWNSPIFALTNFNFTYGIFYFSTLISGVFIFLIGKDTIKITIIETNSSHVSTGKYYR